MGASGLTDELCEIVGEAHVLTDPAQSAPFVTSWTGRVYGSAHSVVRPNSTAEVSEVVRACAHARVPVVPQGGNTGLVGGGVPRGGEVVISLQRLNTLARVDGEVLTAHAGVTLIRAQKLAENAGLQVGIDLGSRDSATLGGIVATNAGGSRVIEHGPLIGQLVGVEAVLADGTVISRLQGLPKDNVGYNLQALLTGSEGTLGIVTRIQLRLQPPVANRAVLFMAYASIQDAFDAFLEIRRHGRRVLAAEYIDDAALDLVTRHLGLPSPFGSRHPCTLLLEVGDSRTDLATLVSHIGEIAPPLDATAVSDAQGRRELWSYRERIPEAVSARGSSLKLDVAVPRQELGSFHIALNHLVNRLGSTVVTFGHLAEANLHVNVLDVAESRRTSVTASILQLVNGHGGTISAEHGVGTDKVRWLGLSRSAHDIATMLTIKKALDPKGILNPGVIFPGPDLGAAPNILDPDCTMETT